MEKTPEENDNNIDCIIPGMVNNSRKNLKDKLLPPKIGKYPNAGNITPKIPKKIGDIITIPPKIKQILTVLLYNFLINYFLTPYLFIHSFSIILPMKGEVLLIYFEVDYYSKLQYLLEVY